MLASANNNSLTTILSLARYYRYLQWAETKLIKKKEKKKKKKKNAL